MKGGRGFRVQLDATQPSRIANRQRAAVVERQRESVPRFVVATARIEQLVDVGGPIDDESTRHPEPKAQHERFIAVIREIKQEKLAVSPCLVHDQPRKDRA